jgi:hypothetical protein
MFPVKKIVTEPKGMSIASKSETSSKPYAHAAVLAEFGKLMSQTISGSPPFFSSNILLGVV